MTVVSPLRHTERHTCAPRGIIIICKGHNEEVASLMLITEFKILPRLLPIKQFGITPPVDETPPTEVSDFLHFRSRI